MRAPINPSTNELARFRRSFRWRQSVCWLAFGVWVAAVVGNIALRPSLVWIAGTWIVVAIIVMIVWRCPRCHEHLGPALFPQQCPHCYLRFRAEAPVHKQPNER
jgi:hypothetical protein